MREKVLRMNIYISSVSLEDSGVRHLQVHQQVAAGAVDVSTPALTMPDQKLELEIQKSNPYFLSSSRRGF